MVRSVLGFGAAKNAVTDLHYSCVVWGEFLLDIGQTRAIAELGEERFQDQ
jgi:hypothetical protein